MGMAFLGYGKTSRRIVDYEFLGVEEHCCSRMAYYTDDRGHLLAEHHSKSNLYPEWCHGTVVLDFGRFTHDMTLELE